MEFLKNNKQLIPLAIACLCALVSMYYDIIGEKNFISNIFNVLYMVFIIIFVIVGKQNNEC